MYETICYEKPFLRQVVARIDFLGAIEALERAVPSKLANAVSERFPIAEPADAIAQELQIGGGAITQQSKVYKQWNFFGKEREKQLSLAAAFALVSYSKYTTYEDLAADFGGVVEALGKIFPDAKAGRFGLRYINSIEIDSLTDGASWGEYMARDLINAGAFFADPKHVTRLIHLAELVYDDMSVRFQFGMPNPDYPAVIKRPHFLLDLDAYIQSAHDLAQTLKYMEQAHERIQDLFEKSITDKLRERMNAKPSVAI